MEILNKIVDKLTSGRFWLTIVVAIAFNYAVRNNILEPAAISSIMTAVFISYFDKQNKGEQK